jgi:hypothetical protein
MNDPKSTKQTPSVNKPLAKTATPSPKQPPAKKKSRERLELEALEGLELDTVEYNLVAGEDE